MIHGTRLSLYIPTLIVCHDYFSFLDASSSAPKIRSIAMCDAEIETVNLVSGLTEPIRLQYYFNPQGSTMETGTMT